ENTFLMVLAHDLGSRAIQQTQIIFLFSLVETSFPERTNRAMVVENDGRRLGRKSDSPSFEGVDNRPKFRDQLRQLNTRRVARDIDNSSSLSVGMTCFSENVPNEC